MRQHLRILAYLHVASGVFYLLAAVAAFFFVLGGGFMTDEEAVIWVATTVGTLLVLYLAVLALPSLIGGAGLLREKLWARPVLLVIGVLSLFVVPVGTALGVYTLWVLLKDESARLLAAGGPLPPDVRA